MPNPRPNIRPEPRPDPSDDNLMTACASGDRNAFDQLVLRHQIMLLNFFVRLGASFEVAEDCTQETLFRLWRRSRAYRADGRFVVWMLKIARNIWHDWQRKNYRPQNSTVALDSCADIADNKADNPNLLAQKKEQVTKILQAVENLSPQLRMTFVLAEVQELKYSEIAEVMDIPIGTVKSRIHAAVAQIRQSMAHQFPEDTHV